jgi:CubicO group peptidase (beta-lactamase class C family)
MFDTINLDIVLQEIVSGWEIPGMSAGIIQDGKIAYTKVSGVQNLDTKKPVTPDTIFCIASISKVFTATAVMQLYQRGAIDLDAPVLKYLPYFKLADERYKLITIRQILSHTSGLPDFDYFEYEKLWKNPEHDEGAQERYVRDLSNRKMISNPGEEFHYSNIGYNVLGDVIAKASGMPFEDYMKEQILIPSGMRHSTFFLQEVDPDLLAFPHLRAPNVMPYPFYPYHRGDAPASFLHTTINDMLNWMTMCLNRGNFKGHEILNPEVWDMMWQPVVNRRTSALYEDMALGWNLGHYKGGKTVSHGGYGGGWTDQLVILPDKNCAMSVLSLDESWSIYRAQRAALDAMLGHEPKVGTLSWAIPVCRALEKGGIEAAYACYEEIKDQTEDYCFEAEFLIYPALHSMTAGRIDTAIDLLKLNIHVFPEHSESHEYLTRAFLNKGRSQKN